MLGPKLSTSQASVLGVLMTLRILTALSRLVPPLCLPFTVSQVRKLEFSWQEGQGWNPVQVQDIKTSHLRTASSLGSRKKERTESTAAKDLALHSSVPEPWGGGRAGISACPTGLRPGSPPASGRLPEASPPSPLQAPLFQPV